MKVVNDLEASRNLGELVENAWDDNDTVVIARPCGRSAVMLSLKGFENLNETASLMSFPGNAKRLIAAIDDHKKRINLIERERVSGSDLRSSESAQRKP